MANTLNPQKLYAISLVAPKTEVRPYLCGVRVEFYKDKTRYVATNGHCAAIYEHEAENQTTGCVTIPKEMVKLFGKRDQHYEVELTREDETLKLSCPALGVSLESLDNYYPDYQSIFHVSTSGEVADFNFEYLGLFARIAKAMKVNPYVLTIHHNGKGSAIIRSGDRGFLGLLMPMRPAEEGATPNRIWHKETCPINLTGSYPTFPDDSAPSTDDPVID